MTRHTAGKSPRCVCVGGRGALRRGAGCGTGVQSPNLAADPGAEHMTSIGSSTVPWWDRWDRGRFYVPLFLDKTVVGQ